MRKSTLNLRSATGFTLVEVLMAATILTVGFMGLIQAVTITSGMMDSARRQTLAAQMLNQEIEKLRLLPWEDIAGMIAGPVDVGFDSQFDSARAAVGDNQTASTPVKFIGLHRAVVEMEPDLHEVTFTVTWEVTTSRRDSSGNPVKFTYTRANSAYFGKYGLNLTYQRS